MISNGKNTLRGPYYLSNAILFSYMTYTGPMLDISIDFHQYEFNVNVLW